VGEGGRYLVMEIASILKRSMFLPPERLSVI